MFCLLHCTSMFCPLDFMFTDICSEVHSETGNRHINAFSLLVGLTCVWLYCSRIPNCIFSQVKMTSDNLLRQSSWDMLDLVSPPCWGLYLPKFNRCSFKSSNGYSGSDWAWLKQQPQQQHNSIYLHYRCLLAAMITGWPGWGFAALSSTAGHCAVLVHSHDPTRQQSA